VAVDLIELLSGWLMKECKKIPGDLIAFLIHIPIALVVPLIIGLGSKEGLFSRCLLIIFVRIEII